MGSHKYEILLGYTAFILVFLFIQYSIGLGSLNARVPIMEASVNSITAFFSLFDISTDIGLLNDVLIVPYLLFLGLLVANYIRGIE